MNWKFWERNDVNIISTLLSDTDNALTVADIIESMSDEQLAFCYYVSTPEYEEILLQVIKNRLRKKSNEL